MTLRLYYDTKWLASVPWDVASLWNVTATLAAKVYTVPWLETTTEAWTLLKSCEETRWGAITFVVCLMAFIALYVYRTVRFGLSPGS